ncbi:MAG: pyridoxamine 5'-phosphate oxidase [Deltaproteobacteria bacterium]|nr:pyridoxamine 5'-phosphate oxidase [Deltaproteobacteria bacterium]
MDLAALRKEYGLKGLYESDAHPDPVQQFRVWMQAALDAQLPEPNAMTLCTVDADGAPDGRIVLLKNVDEHGFAFFTNHESDKGRQLAAQPRAGLVFCWLELERQVRIRGTAHKLAAAEAHAYFQQRPRTAQLGAWASPQSRVIPDRAFLEARLEEETARYADEPVVPMPPHWGGYRVHPDVVEFWQGRPSRLHDRLRYRRHARTWTLERLAP